MSTLTLGTQLNGTETPPRPHLGFLDGLRGLAALFIVAHHAYFENRGMGEGPQMPHAAALLTNWLLYGHYAVSVFIVLSGYCLMLPIMQTADGRLRGGVTGFAWRRSRRILPPYYVALAFSLLMIALIPAMRHPTGDRWDVALPAFTPGILLTHLFLVHNLSWAWLAKIDYSTWSVASEWQIYFIFALLLLPIWRRFGILATVAVAFAVGIAPHYLMHGKIDCASPWFLGLFSLGMMGAELTFPTTATARRLRDNAPWNWLAVCFLVVFCTIAEFRFSWIAAHSWESDTLIGALTVCTIMFCAQHCSGAEAHKKPIILKVFEAPATMALGAFSYSLYLVHPPVLALLHLAAHPLHLSASKDMLCILMMGIPLCLIVAYLFHIAFERPFLSSKRKMEVVSETKINKKATATV